MSDNENADQEPTMEEILASIRRIISEDEDADGAQSEVENEAQAADDTADGVNDGGDEPPAPAGDAATEEDVLDLTDVVEEPAEVTAEPEPDTVPAEPASELSEASSLIDEIDPASETEAIVDEAPGAFASAAFHDLSQVLAAEYEGAGKTLEDLVRDMLRPMLKAWLDENLPGVVERMVAQEIARLARRKGK